MAFAAAAVVAWIAISGGIRLEGQDRGGGGVLHYGVSVAAFSDVNVTDGLAASVVFSRALGRAAGLWTDAQANLLEDNAAVVNGVNSGAVDIVVLSAMQYLEIEREVKADPLLLYELGSSVFEEYVLLAREGVNSVADLAGRPVLVFNPAPRRDLGDTWLDVQLMEAGIAGGTRALQQMQLTKKRGQASVAAFFGRVDAGVEAKTAFETNVELNPQLGKKLKILARSAPLLPTVVCVRRSMSPETRKRFADTAVRMHEQPQYRQMFLVMRIKKLVPFAPNDLASTRQLNERYAALRAKPAAGR